MLLSASLLAENQPAAGGGTAWFIPLMLVVMVLLFILPMRRQRKAQAQMKQKQATMELGTRVMTSFGLFGTVVELDRDENKAVLEVAPGTTVTVHLQTVTTILDDQPTAAAGSAPAGATDAAAIDRPGTATSATEATGTDPLAGGLDGSTGHGADEPHRRDEPGSSGRPDTSH